MKDTTQQLTTILWGLPHNFFHVLDLFNFGLQIMKGKADLVITFQQFL
jgi:hypothetical protein